MLPDGNLGWSGTEARTCGYDTGSARRVVPLSSAPQSERENRRIQSAGSLINLALGNLELRVGSGAPYGDGVTATPVNVAAASFVVS